MKKKSNHRVYLGKLQDGYLQYFQEGLRWIGFADMVSSESRIFIKPNLTYPYYVPGVMTSPEALEAAILALKEYSSRLVIGDSDSGGYNRFSMNQVYHETGIFKFAEEHGVKVVNLSSLETEPVSIDVQGKLRTFRLPRLLTRGIDYLITMPVPKVHMNTTVSLSFKNQWGCIPENADRLKLHPYLRYVLPKLNELIHAEVTMMDGRFGLTGSGPLRGETVRLDWVLVSNSLGSAARTACDLMQIPVDSIYHLRYASGKGLIPSIANIQFNQEHESFKQIRFEVKKAWTDFPGHLSFRFPFFAWLAYFSPFADFLHKVLYLFREPFFDYERYSEDK
jgi:uncharacterized protein (DUF362 family)